MQIKDSALTKCLSSTNLDETLKNHFSEFFECYLHLALERKISMPEALSTMEQLFEEIQNQITAPFCFPSVHSPSEADSFFYDLGLRIAEPLIHTNPTIQNPHILKEVEATLARGENVIFAANHQTELEPQILSLVCDPIAKDLFRNTFFVAGERVTTDPMAAPLSRGRHLFCIYAKRYIAEDKQVEIDRRMHNLKTIKQMKELLNQGGACIYVALGGGRDRPDAENKIQLTPFDPSSVGLFTLLSHTAKKPTHIYPLVVSTFNVLPPPVAVQKELGERRWTQGGDVKVAFGEKFAFEPFLSIENKETMNLAITEALFQKLKDLYTPYPGFIAP
ncbi:MAG: 1-acyl-sn-glycerol-3-phosphate acyltransferase [Chlamydiia bacterium]